ncbi:MAG: DUF2281 domain-containing protein [Oscillospiraceae bacterium]|nr:DUF2281 domain-containing protein [Oscillospiraceae bacterium]
MTQTHQELVNRISSLSVEKLNIVMTFVHFIETQKSKEESFDNHIKRTKKPLTESRGVFKGKIWMSDDFNDELEDMREYM